LLFIGTTADLKQALKDRKNNDVYSVECSNLVYYELIEGHEKALEKETAIKAMTRAERRRFIKAFNPQERDLSAEL